MLLREALNCQDTAKSAVTFTVSCFVLSLGKDMISCTTCVHDIFYRVAEPCRFPTRRVHMTDILQYSLIDTDFVFTTSVT
jgi:hypothetical protein